VSNIAGPNKWTLEEAWIQQVFGRFSLLLGKYDLNSEFDRLHGADLFLNSSFGTNPALAQTGQAGPSIFPNTALGGRLEFKPFDNLVLRVALLDGVPVERAGGWDAFAEGDGLLVVSEAAFLYRPVPGKSVLLATPSHFLVGRSDELQSHQAKLAVGFWQYTATFPDLNTRRAGGASVQHEGSAGGYLIGETVLYQTGDDRQIRVFGQVSIADERVNRFHLFLGGGVTAKGFVPCRPEDEIGFGVAAAYNGDPYRASQRRLGLRTEDTEVALEIPYLAPVTSWLSVQPDLQYVIHPNTDPRQSDAFIALVRVELSF